MAAYSAAERAALERSMEAGGQPACPACSAPVDVRPVDPPAGVAYVRRRVWILCPSCRRTAALELPDPLSGR